jgi:hypothetical protein
MTGLDFVRRAMRSIGVLQQGEVPSAQEASDALGTLNDMLQAWRLDGIDLEFEDLTLTSFVPLAREDTRAIRYCLALELAGEFGMTPGQGVLKYAAEGLQQMRAKYSKIRSLSVDDGLLENRRFDIYTG